MLNIDNIFDTVIGNTFYQANNDMKAELLKSLIECVKRYNVMYGDGTVDMYSNEVHATLSFKEKYVVPLFGKGAKTIQGTYHGKRCKYYSIYSGDAQRLGFPAPDLIIARITGREYYLYFIAD